MTNKVNVVTVAVIYNDKNELLIAKRSIKEDHVPGIYSYPGGKVECDGEEKNILENNLKREIKEETNAEIDDLEYFHSHSFKKENGDQIIIMAYIARYVSGDITKFQEEEVEELKWINITEIQSLNTLEIVKEVYNLAYAKLSTREKLHHLSVAGLILNEKDEFLLLKYRDKKLFGLPKGDVYSVAGNTWEVLEINLMQEILSQTGLKIADGPIPFTDEAFIGHDGFDDIVQFFICKLESGDLMNNAELVTDAKWVKFEQFDKNEISKMEYLVYQKANKFLNELKQ